MQLVCFSFDFEAPVCLLGLIIEANFSSLTLGCSCVDCNQSSAWNHCIKGKAIQIEKLLSELFLSKYLLINNQKLKCENSETVEQRLKPLIRRLTKKNHGNVTRRIRLVNKNSY